MDAEEHLARIDALRRVGATPRAVLEELRGLVRGLEGYSGEPGRRATQTESSPPSYGRRSNQP